MYTHCIRWENIVDSLLHPVRCNIVLFFFFRSAGEDGIYSHCCQATERCANSAGNSRNCCSAASSAQVQVASTVLNTEKYLQCVLWWTPFFFFFIYLRFSFVVFLMIVKFIQRAKTFERQTGPLLHIFTPGKPCARSAPLPHKSPQLQSDHSTTAA